MNATHSLYDASIETETWQNIARPPSLKATDHGCHHISSSQGPLSHQLNATNNIEIQYSGYSSTSEWNDRLYIRLANRTALFSLRVFSTPVLTHPPCYLFRAKKTRSNYIAKHRFIIRTVYFRDTLSLPIRALIGDISFVFIRFTLLSFNLYISH